MYLGGVLLFMCAPLLLGSRYGVMGGVLLTVLVVVRLIGEENMLVRELEGYAEYKKKVKYRLIPFVW
jgi:protein-S-isoprenylcysteine O-methyltransferase Ste14